MPRIHLRMWIVHLLCALLVCGRASIVRADKPSTAPAAAHLPATAPSTQPHFAIGIPSGPTQLHSIETQVETVVKRVMPATVGVVNGMAQGSGVIISPDGFILTAGHVAAEADRPVDIILSDGRRIKGKTLGINHNIDSGLIKILDDTQSEWPFVYMGTTQNLKVGDWVIAMGHPGGYQKGRPPVVRLGRVLEKPAGAIRTDCTLIGGDSGGPLFDLDGNVVGIHSRISNSVEWNLHVPIDTFTATWNRLASGEVWGARFGGPVTLGFVPARDPNGKGIRVLRVDPDSPADRAGLKQGDLITTVEATAVKNTEEYFTILGRHKLGDELQLAIERGDEKLEVKAKIVRRRFDAQ